MVWQTQQNVNPVTEKNSICEKLPRPWYTVDLQSVGDKKAILDFQVKAVRVN